MANVKLEEVVASWLEINNLGKAEYSKMYQIGIKGIRDLNMDATGQLKFYDLTLDNNLTAKLPSDFINEVEVYVRGDRNAGLLKDNTLGIYEFENDDYEEEFCIDDFSDLDFNNKAKNTGGIDWIGRYRIDKERNRIYVNTEFCYSCITLGYLASPQSTEGGEWLINELAVEALDAYLTWKESVGRRSAGPYERRDNKRNYSIEKRKAKIRMKNLTRGQMQDNSRSSIKYKIKN